MVYAPLGPTHLAFEDLSLFRHIPNMTIVAPCDAEEMKRLMPQTLDHEGPIYIRLAKGGDTVVSSPDKEFKIGKAILMREGNNVLVVTTGITLKLALDAAEELQKTGVSLKILHVHTVKPIDVAAIVAAAKDVQAVISVEENSMVGGLGSAVAEIIAEAGFSSVKKFLRMGLPDAFPTKYGSQEKMMNACGLSKDGIIKAVTKLLGK